MEKLLSRSMIYYYLGVTVTTCLTKVKHEKEVRMVALFVVRPHPIRGRKEAIRTLTCQMGKQ